MSSAPPEPVFELASACLDYVRRSLGFDLDFSPETLPVLDHYVATVRELKSERPELVRLVGPATGAYFGEVVRVVIPGFWRVPTLNQHDWQLCCRLAFLWFNPLGVAYDAIHGTSEHDGPRSILRALPEDRVLLENRLAAMPPLPEEQYFSFSTRLEVLEAAHETLRARMEEQGYGTAELGEEDYLAELRLN